MLSDSQLANIRARFPIFRRAVYLNSCSQGALSESSEATLREFVGSWNQYGSPWDMWVEQYETCRREFAAMIGAGTDEVAIVASVSAGVSSLATAFDFRKRSGVVMGAFEFPTMGHVWLAQQPRGARVHFIEPEHDRIPAAAYERAITDETLIVPVTGICFMNGVRSQVREIVDIAHARGSYVLLDDYQDCGTRPRNMRELDVDFYASGTLKYLLGASGIAFLYVKKDLIPALQPLVSGWFAQQNPFAFATETFEPSPTARRFESGTPPIPNVYFALAGIRLLREIGLENVEHQVRRLTQLLIQGAKERGFHLKTPADSAGPLVVLKARDAAALVTILAKEDIICSSRHDGLRISFHVYNTPEDVTLVLRSLDKHRDLLVSEARPIGVNG